MHGTDVRWIIVLPFNVNEHHISKKCQEENPSPLHPVATYLSQISFIACILTISDVSFMNLLSLCTTLIPHINLSIVVHREAYQDFMFIKKFKCNALISTNYVLIEQAYAEDTLDSSHTYKII